MNKLILFSILLSTLIQGCKKSPRHYTINTELMNAYGFKQGTYWIYKDSLSGEIDSFAVTYSVLENTQQTGFAEDYYYVIISTFKNDSFKIKWDLVLTDSTAGLSFENYSDQMEGNLNYLLFNYPIFDGQFTQEYDSSYVVGIFNNYSFLNYNFRSVAQIHHFSTGHGNIMKHDDWFYVCDNIGFVKIIFNHPQDSVYRNWGLLRYHIAK